MTTLPAVPPTGATFQQWADAITVEQLRAAGSVKWSMVPDAIGAFVAEMDFGTAPAVTRALHEAVDSGPHGYLPTAVADAMSAACAQWQQDTYGWSVDAAQVHPIADVIKGLEIAIEHYSAPGSKVILPVPAYMPFFMVPGLYGREIIEVPMITDADGVSRYDLAGLDAAFAAGGNLLVLCNPYNPLGRVLDRAELAAVSVVVERHGGRVFADEIHSPLVHPGRTHLPYASISPVAAGHTITATSASKAFNLPGLKCAQLIIGNDADAEVWERIGPFATHGAANLGVIANTAAYTEGRGWLDDVLGYLDRSRHLLAELLAEHLPQVRYTAPEGTYIGWLDCRDLPLPAGVGAADFFREHAGVALTDGAACGAPGFARLIFATPQPILVRAVRQMGAAVSSARAA